jgi:5-formaminoimidazole-4-carboxamide-1-beta-D-ribofuranosyl 5'-monophosphate synthetase
MKVHNKQVKNLVKQHILDCVLNDEGQYFTDFEELKNHVKSEFNRVANNANNLRKYPNHQDRFSDYLNGLPFNFHYYFDDIKEYLNYLGINPQNKDYSDERAHKLYHLLIFKEIFND